MGEGVGVVRSINVLSGLRRRIGAGDRREEKGLREGPGKSPCLSFAGGVVGVMRLRRGGIAGGAVARRCERRQRPSGCGVTSSRGAGAATIRPPRRCCKRGVSEGIDEKVVVRKGKV